MTAVTDLDDSQIRLGRNWLRSGDPCRWRRHRGLFRFVKVDKHGETLDDTVLELVGPVANPRTRFVQASNVVRVRPTDALRAVVAAR